MANLVRLSIGRMSFSSRSCSSKTSSGTVFFSIILSRAFPAAVIWFRFTAEYRVVNRPASLVRSSANLYLAPRETPVIFGLRRGVESDAEGEGEGVCPFKLEDSDPLLALGGLASLWFISILS